MSWVFALPGRVEFNPVEYAELLKDKCEATHPTAVESENGT
jgi:hypothetical protein